MSVLTGEKSFSCPAAKICNLSFEDAPVCGDDPTHITDPVPPHMICANALWNRYQAAHEDTTEPIWGRKLAMEADLLINLGAHPDTKNSEARGYFNTAQYLISLAKKTPRTRQPHATNAGLLNLFLSTYSGYSHGLHLSGQDRHVQRQGLSRLMHRVRTAPIDKSPLLGRGHVDEENHVPCFVDEDEQKSFYTKLALMQLVLKGGFDILPAPYRTRRDCDALVWHKDNFTPINTLTVLRGGHSVKPAGVLVFPFKNIARKANRQPDNTVLIDKTAGEVADRAAYLLEKETTLPMPDFKEEETLLLNEMATIVRQSIVLGRVISS